MAELYAEFKPKLRYALFCLSRARPVDAVVDINYNSLSYSDLGNSIANGNSTPNVNNVSVAHSVSDGNSTVDGNSIVWDMSSLCESLTPVSQSTGSIKEVTVRSRIDSLSDSAAFKDSAHSQTKFISMFSEKLSICCTICRVQVLSKTQFRRVLPLPSSGWTDMVDNWFCHQHDGESMENYKTALTPKSGDLLVGHYSSLALLADVNNVVVTESTVKCRHCKQTLGQTHSERVVEIYHQNLVYKAAALEPVLSVEYAFSAQISEQCLTAMTYKFIIESSARPGDKASPYLLLWVMELNLHLLFGNSCGGVDSFPAIKVLYRSVTGCDTDVYLQWLADNKVCAIGLPEVTCSNLSQLLQENSRRLPATMADIQTYGMKVSFLRC